MNRIIVLFLLLKTPSILFAQPDGNEARLDFSRLISMLSTKPYVEQECKDTTFADWPFQAKVCTYSTASPIGKNLHIIVANPSVEQLKNWIIDAGDQIEAIRYLKENDPLTYVKGLIEMARFIKYQSSFIFPLDGQIWEDMLGDGVGKIYQFQKGVTKTKSTTGGKYCRIISLTREEYATYVVARIDSTINKATLLKELMLYQSWCDTCLAIHKQAWTNTKHEGFRAKAYQWNQEFLNKYPDFKNMSYAKIVAKLKKIIFP